MSADAAAIVAQIPDELPKDRRFVVAIAGPPAAGKSTLASAVVTALGEQAGLLAMDGFHFDNDILDERGHRSRKGAPHTFDVAAYAMTLRALCESPKTALSVPVYDRSLGAARNCALIVEPHHRILVTEGNYLLLRDAPWKGLSQWFDLTVWLDVPLSTIDERIRTRWVLAGHPAEEVERRAEENDLPNARTVVSQSVEADVIIG